MADPAALGGQTALYNLLSTPVPSTPYQSSNAKDCSTNSENSRRGTKKKKTTSQYFAAMGGITLSQKAYYIFKKKQMIPFMQIFFADSLFTIQESVVVHRSVELFLQATDCKNLLRVILQT